MAANLGKPFEEALKRSVPKAVYFYRLKDSVGNWNRTEDTFFTPKNDYDCFMYQHPFLHTIELKSYKKSSFPMKNYKKGQLEGLKRASEYYGIIAGTLFWIIDIDRVFFIEYNLMNITDDCKFVFNDKERASIPNQWIIDNGIEVFKAERGRTKVYYDISRFIEDVTKDKIRFAVI